jgi:hypothetical protein
MLNVLHVVFFFFFTFSIPFLSRVELGFGIVDWFGRKSEDAQDPAGKRTQKTEEEGSRAKR